MTLSNTSEGPLIIIGGHEDKEGDKVILKAVAERLNGGRLVIATIASHAPEGYFESYQKAFATLGVTDLVELYIDDRGRDPRAGEAGLAGRRGGRLLLGRRSACGSAARSATRRSRPASARSGAVAACWPAPRPGRR
jgi:cyanophycinase